MPYEVELKELINGFTAHPAKAGEKVEVITRQFLSSEDGSALVKCLTQVSSVFFPLIDKAYKTAIFEYSIYSMLIILNKNKMATIYLNNDVVFEYTARPKRDLEKNSIITRNDIADIGYCAIKNIDIPDTAGFFLLFSCGWERGFLYDLSPLAPNNTTRNYNFEKYLGGLFTYLMFQDRIRVSDRAWEILFQNRWFPFAYLNDSLIVKIIEYAENGNDIDSLLGDISKDIKELISRADIGKLFGPFFVEHGTIVKQGFDRYCESDYISCNAILYPRIEGLLRSFQRHVKSGQNANGYRQKILVDTTIMHSKDSRNEMSLILPEKFKRYLEEIYFKDFTPGSNPDLSRHSVSHGEASVESFNLKNASIAVLVIYQLGLFMK